jgi:hypothetical protein
VLVARRLFGVDSVRCAQREARLGRALRFALTAASAIPKSAMTGFPSGSRMFAGLMSWWTTPRRYA